MILFPSTVSEAESTSYSSLLYVMTFNLVIESEVHYIYSLMESQNTENKHTEGAVLHLQKEDGRESRRLFVIYSKPSSARLLGLA